jgi:hypothetical protein
MSDDRHTDPKTDGVRPLVLRHHAANLVRNVVNGLRLPLFMHVSPLNFRVDLVQLLLLLVVSALIDVGTDWARYGANGYFSWLGLGTEIFGAGILLLTAAVLALAVRTARGVTGAAGLRARRISAAADRARAAVDAARADARPWKSRGPLSTR